MKAIFLAWAKYHSRTDYLGQALNARVYFVWRLPGARRFWHPLKYLLQAWETIAILRREQPGIVLVQTPPVFPAVIACLYAAWRPAAVILDTHSGTYLSNKWRWSLPLQRWCSRRARLTVVHLPALLPRVRRWGAPALVAGYIGGPHPAPEAFPLPAGFNVAVPCSFNPDEPIDAILDAARSLPAVHFVITGNLARLPARCLRARPDNVTFTGYLSFPAYLGLLQNAQAVMALTTQGDTLQWAGVEAIAFGRPVITSDWPALRQVFRRGAVFVDNSPAGIAGGIVRAQARWTELASEAQALKCELDREWEANLTILRTLVQGSSLPTSAGSPTRPWQAGETA